MSIHLKVKVGVGDEGSEGRQWKCHQPVFALAVAVGEDENDASVG